MDEGFINLDFISSVSGLDKWYIFSPLSVERECAGLWIIIVLFVVCGCQSESKDKGWEVYKADANSSSYSPLDKINKENVDQLEVAWSYRTGDFNDGGSSTMETNPIVINDVLYGGTPKSKVFAVDAKTGDELWMFDPFPEDPPGGYMRGVTYWEEGSDKRILFSSGTFLFALDAKTGELIEEFGENGRVNLNKGLGRDPNTISVKSPSPGIIYEDLIIMGSAVGENYGAAPGHIRAYNVRTGQQEWIFHTIPKPGDFGYGTWGQAQDGQEIRKGGVNNWAGMSLDDERGIVYVPLGSSSYDFYGGDRTGKNLFANSLVALKASTGEYIWHFQTVHHDLWDYDLPAPPNLLTVERDGEKIDAVAQVAKTGFTFVFNRETGDPLFDVEERPVPQTNIDREDTWPTQPYPVAPEPFVRQGIEKEDLNDLSSEIYDSAFAQFQRYRSEGLFTPPDSQGAIVSPSTRGGANWGGAAHDPETGMLYINANETPGISTVRRVKRNIPGSGTIFDKGKAIYKQSCATCHGTNLEGQHPTYPALNNVHNRLEKEEVFTIIEKGGARMPAFTNISEDEKDALIAFLFKEEVSTARKTEKDSEIDENRVDDRFQNITAYSRFEAPNGLPGIKPPWGTLSAVNLNTGIIEWKTPLGTHPDLADQDISPTGMESWGGPIVTGGGIVFIGGTRDKKFRAFDKHTGQLLWKTTLPTGGFATPTTYMVENKQYIVIAVGGGRGIESGDYYIAFTLSE